MALLVGVYLPQGVVGLISGLWSKFSRSRWFRRGAK